MLTDADGCNQLFAALLRVPTRHKLLLTGTPRQNTLTYADVCGRIRSRMLTYTPRQNMLTYADLLTGTPRQNTLTYAHRPVSIR